MSYASARAESVGFCSWKTIIYSDEGGRNPCVVFLFFFENDHGDWNTNGKFILVTLSKTITHVYKSNMQMDTYSKLIVHSISIYTAEVWYFDSMYVTLSLTSAHIRTCLAYMCGLPVNADHSHAVPVCAWQWMRKSTFRAMHLITMHFMWRSHMHAYPTAIDENMVCNIFTSFDPHLTVITWETNHAYRDSE